MAQDKAWKREQGLHSAAHPWHTFGKGPELRRQVCAAADKTGQTTGLTCARQYQRQQGRPREVPFFGDSERNRVRNKVGVGIKRGVEKVGRPSALRAETNKTQRERPTLGFRKAVPLSPLTCL